MGDNNKICGKYVDRMMQKVPTTYLGIVLAVGLRVLSKQAGP